MSMNGGMDKESDILSSGGRAGVEHVGMLGGGEGECFM